MTSSLAVANYFIAKSIIDGTPINYLKLEMLVYYSYAWCIASDDTCLFGDAIEAYDYGPCVTDLYKNVFSKNTYRKMDYIIYAAFPITQYVDGSCIVTELGIPCVDFVYHSYLDKIWITYKSYTSTQLCNMSHGQDEPWKEMKELANENNINPIIPPRLISIMFKQKLKDQHGSFTVPDESVVA